MAEIIKDEARLKTVELYLIDNVKGGYAVSSIERMVATIRALWKERDAMPNKMAQDYVRDKPWLDPRTSSE